jgi:uncharacterized protein (UPF0333 family)
MNKFLLIFVVLVIVGVIAYVIISNPKSKTNTDGAQQLAAKGGAVNTASAPSQTQQTAYSKAAEDLLVDLASKKVPLNRGGTSGNRTKMQEWAYEQESYRIFKSAVMDSNLTMPQKLQAIEDMRLLLWDGVFKDYKSGRAKRLANIWLQGQKQSIKLAITAAKFVA